MGSAAALLQVVPSISLYAKKIFLTSTPQRITGARKLVLKFDFGTTLPKMSLLATIGPTFSVVSQVSIITLDLNLVTHSGCRPVTNLVSCFTFALFWFSWKFLFIWVYVLRFQKFLFLTLV
jgi:calcium permeable stress-gated cation channel